jgi:hypothetical protein
MNAVATMTPEPKYLTMKKIQSGTPMLLCRFARTGNKAPEKSAFMQLSIDLQMHIHTQPRADKDDKYGRNSQIQLAIILVASFARRSKFVHIEGNVSINDPRD